MPLYDYECLSCGHVFELRQRFTADPEGVCPRCAGLSRRKFHAVPIIYKGSGFYTTDYAHSSSSAQSKKENEDSKETSKEKSTPVKATKESTEGKKEVAKAATGTLED